MIVLEVDTPSRLILQWRRLMTCSVGDSDGIFRLGSSGGREYTAS